MSRKEKSKFIDNIVTIVNSDNIARKLNKVVVEKKASWVVGGESIKKLDEEAKFKYPLTAAALAPKFLALELDGSMSIIQNGLLLAPSTSFITLAIAIV